MDVRQLVFGQIGIARHRRRRGRLRLLETLLAWPIEAVLAILPESALALSLALLRLALLRLALLRLALLRLARLLTAPLLLRLRLRFLHCR